MGPKFHNDPNTTKQDKDLVLQLGTLPSQATSPSPHIKQLGTVSCSREQTHTQTDLLFGKIYQ